MIEEINPETHTENVAAEVERFASATFKGKVKDSNYDWKEIAHYDDTLPTFESSDLSSLYKNKLVSNNNKIQVNFFIFLAFIIKILKLVLLKIPQIYYLFNLRLVKI